MFEPLENIEGSLRPYDAVGLTQALAQHTLGKADHIKQIISQEAVDTDIIESLSISRNGVPARHTRSNTNDDADTAVNNTPRLGSPEPPSSGDSGTSTPNTAVNRSSPPTPKTIAPVSTFKAIELEDKLSAKGAFQSQVDYQLRDHINAASQSLNLPTDRRRHAEHAIDGARCHLHLDVSRRQHLAKLGHENGTALTAVALVAWGIVVSRLSGEETLVIGVSHGDEKRSPTEALPVSIDFSGEPNTLQLLERIKNALYVADDILSVKPQDIQSFQVAFHSHRGTLASPATDYVSEQCDLSLHMLEDEEDFALSIHYATALYNKDTVERYATYVEAIFESMLANPNQPVALFDIMSPAEKALILETWNDTNAEYPNDRCIHQLFEDQVEKSPEAVAIVHGDRSFTYRELDSVANHFARQLVDAGVRPGDFVALLLLRSIELVASELAVLKIGAAYIPIDVKAPADRQAYIASDSAAKLLITDEERNVPSHIQLPVLRLSAKHEYTEKSQVLTIASAQSRGQSLFMMSTKNIC
ncbi:hypothetical protein BGZ83_001727 [Gryganskiella cystojenkinii]|nr:hypothetical protein BGZ83_001727 [Gryganskiella cystojenkinii]